MLGVALTACGSVFVIVSWLNSFYHMESFVYGVLALVVVILGVNGWKILAQRLKEKKQRLLVRFGDVPLEKVGRPSSGATYVILPQK
jgi:chromate transport protein ChrA